MPTAKLPNFLRPIASAHLTRIGRDHDGGYLVDARDIDAANLLIGLGINDDWSFEQDFKARRDVPILAFDGSISERKFLTRMIKSATDFARPRLFFRHRRTWASYRNFFRNDTKHIKAFVGHDQPPTHIPMSRVFDKAFEQTPGRVFLKVDIEGHEYRILDDLIANAARSTGLVIELHDCDLHLARIADFIDRYPLHLIHLHVNNYGLTGARGMPTVIELTFSMHAPSGDPLVLPHALDMPNNPQKAEPALTFTAA